MENEMEKNEVVPTLKGYETAFLGFTNLLKNGKLNEDDYLILDIYSRMATGMKIEDLLETISGKKYIVVQKEGMVYISRT